MSKEILKSKIVRTAVAGLAALSITACGRESKKDHGSDKISECPRGYTEGARPINGSREQFRVELAKATADLSSLLPLNGAGRPATQFSNQDGKLSEAINAGATVFYKDTAYDPPVFEIDTPETKVDDLSEQFCASGGELYVAPGPATAIGAMAAIGVDTKALEAFTK